MFEHFKAFFANSRNQKVMIFVVCFIILLSVLKHFGLYEAFTDASGSTTTNAKSADAKSADAKSADAKSADAKSADAKSAGAGTTTGASSNSVVSEGKLTTL